MSKIFLVTGASSGFGKSICETLVKKGYRVIGAARRIEKLQKMKEELGEKFYPLKMDVSKNDEIDKSIDSLPSDWKDINVLVNNAGVAIGLEKAQEANFADWQVVINTNIIGTTYLTHKLLPRMVEKNSGQIINLGSIAGTYPYPGGNIYGASKAYVRQLSLNLRADLYGTKIRVSNIEPGLCGGTEFSNVRFRGDDERAAKMYEGTNSIQPDDIANTVLWLCEMPEHVNINTIEMMPVSQTFGALPVYRD